MTTRRLAAILVADVVGFSRLMEADEARTLQALKERRKVILEPVVREHGGRIVKVMGDGVLVEFSSAVAAVEAALALQERMAAANGGLPAERRIMLRIGINLGDVIGEGSDIYGDGVNVAARLESLAEPGGICISGKVHEEVRGKLAVAAEDLGEVALKNLVRPVRAFQLAAQTTMQSDDSAPGSRHDRPSIAILPFVNMSGDPEQEYFSDGITEDIITELSRFRDLLVIARNSSFTYKGRAADVKEVGRRLGARYVVEGSVRKAGNRVRVTAQLIEARAGNHLWAERYDRDIADIFAVQDEVVSAIAGSIPGHLNRLAVEHLRRTPPGNHTAYDCELRGRWALTHWNEGLAEAIDWFEQAIKADPGYALAHAGMAMACSYALYVQGLPPETALARAAEHARLATVLDDRNPTVNAYAAIAYMLCGEHRLSRSHAERAVSLNPNDPFTLNVQAQTLTYAGEPEEALKWYERSERIEPYAPDDQRLDCLCDCYYMLREYHKVIEIHEMHHNFPAFLCLPLSAACAQSGDFEKARAAVEKYERLRPPGHDPRTMIAYAMRMLAKAKDREHWLEGYRKAGFDV